MDASEYRFHLKEIIIQITTTGYWYFVYDESIWLYVKVAQYVKMSPEIPVVVGGTMFALPEEIMAYDFIDFAVVREGKLHFELIGIIKDRKRNWDAIDGLVFKNGNIIRNKPRV